MCYSLKNYLNNLALYHKKINITGRLYCGNKWKLLEKFKSLGCCVIDADFSDLRHINLNFLKNKFKIGRIIGITGPSGAGKTTLCKRLKKLYNCRIIDADEIAHHILETNENLKKELLKAFGSKILKNCVNALKINRSALKTIVSKFDNKLIELNKIMFNYLAKEIIYSIQNKINEGKNVILDAPLLFEYSLNTICDDIIVLLYDGSRSRWKV